MPAIAHFIIPGWGSFFFSFLFFFGFKFRSHLWVEHDFYLAFFSGLILQFSFLGWIFEAHALGAGQFNFTTERHCWQNASLWFLSSFLSSGSLKRDEWLPVFTLDWILVRPISSPSRVGENENDENEENWDGESNQINSPFLKFFFFLIHSHRLVRGISGVLVRLRAIGNLNLWIIILYLFLNIDALLDP